MSSRRRTTAIILAIVAVICAFMGIAVASKPYVYDGASVCASPFQAWSGHETGVQAFVGIFEATDCSRWTNALGAIAIALWAATVALVIVAVTLAARARRDVAMPTPAVAASKRADRAAVHADALTPQRYTARLAAPDGTFRDIEAESPAGGPQHHLKLDRADGSGADLWELHDGRAWPVVVYRLTAPVAPEPEPYVPRPPTFPAS